MVNLKENKNTFSMFSDYMYLTYGPYKDFKQYKNVSGT